MAQDIQPGIYSVDYFSGAQVALYIGDVLVDEVTSLSWEVRQNRSPIYGYSSQLFDAVSKGQVLIQGQFTINFKEAGYLWLILNRYQQFIHGNPGKLLTPFTSSEDANQQNIEDLINGEVSTSDRNRMLSALADQVGASSVDTSQDQTANGQAQAFASLAGFSSVTRATNGIGKAENVMETFEDFVWNNKDDPSNGHRRADDNDLNPFDIYIAYGDFQGDNRVNHTIQKLTDVHIFGTSKQIVIDGQPIQEQYTFLARNMI